MILCKLPERDIILGMIQNIRFELLVHKDKILDKELVLQMEAKAFVPFVQSFPRIVYWTVLMLLW